MQVATSSRWGHRSVGAAGAVFVLSFLVATFVGASELGGPDETAETIARDMSGRLDDLGANAALVGLSVVAGYWFVGALHRELSGRSASPAVWVAFAGGLGMVTMVLATSAFAQAAILVESLASDPQVAKTLWLVEHGSWALIGPPQIAFVIGVSTLAIVEGYPARWLGYSGVLVASGLVFNMAWGLGGLAALGLLWVLGLALVLSFSVPEQHLSAPG